MSSVVAAFDPPIAKVGDFTMRIDAPQIVTQLETPIPVRIYLENAGTQTLRGKVRLQVIDRWKVVSANPQSFELPPKSERMLEFTVVAGKGTHNAHYPIHAFAEWDEGRGTRDGKRAHAVLVVEVRAPREPKPPKEPIVRLPERGSVPLWQQGNHQVSFQVFGQPMQRMPKGWWGTDEPTGAHAILQRVDRGATKDAIAIHPPWRKGAGTIFVDWQIALPKSQPIFLDFAFAIRDHDPQREPPSDGVTVRVWVKRTDAGKTGSREARKAQKSASKPSTKIANPTATRQIGKLLPLQEPEQLFVGSPVSCPDFLSDDQIKGIVVTHTPTQGCVENFLGAPVNAAMVDDQFCQEFLKSEERLCSHWSSFCQRFYQTTQDFIFKPIGNMGLQFAAEDVRNQRSCRQTYFQRFIQQDNCQEDRCVYDDDFLLVTLLSHPLANSLCLRKPLKMPLPFTPKLARNQSINSSREILPSVSSRIFCLNSLATVRSSTDVALLFRFATPFHLTPQFWRSAIDQVVANPEDRRFFKLLLLPQKLVKPFVRSPENGFQFLSQHKVNGVIVTAAFDGCHCPNFVWCPVAMMPVHEGIGKGEQVHEPTVRLFRKNWAGEKGMRSFSCHRFPESATNFIRPSVWYVSLNQTCLNVGKQLESAKFLAKRFPSQRDSQNSDGSIYHPSSPLFQFRPPSLNCESASSAASMNSQLATPCRLILFSHQFQAASGPFVSFNSFNLRVTNSRSLRYLAAKISNSERLGELFAFAIFAHSPLSFLGEIANPTDFRQIGKFLTLQEPQQLFVGSPVSCPNFLSDDQIKGIVVTHTPTQSSIENFLSTPVNTTTMNHHKAHEPLKCHKDGDRCCQQRSPFGYSLHQTTEDFVLKPFWNMGFYLMHGNRLHQPASPLPYIFGFVPQHKSEKNRSIYDDFWRGRFDLLSHPLANSLRLNNPRKMPLPAMAKFSSHHRQNSSQSPLPFRNSANLLSNSKINSSVAVDDFRLDISNHPAQPLCHPIAFDGGGAPTQDGDDEWRLLYERHSDSKVWLPVRVDLREFAGQQIILRIEVHPGPKNDTTCDTAFIGEPYLVAGRKPPEPTEPKVDERLRLAAFVRWKMVQAADKWGLLPKDFQARKQLMALQLLAPIAKTADELKRVNEIATQLLKRIKVSPQQKPLSLFSHSASSPQSLISSPSSTQPAVWVNLHEGEFYAYALQPPTQSGWWDALGAIVFADRELFFDGFDLRVLGDNLSDWRSPSVLLSKSEKVEGNRLIVTHSMERSGVLYTLTMLAWLEGGTLKVRWQLATTAPQDKHQPLRITDCSVRSWSETAERIYIGHGNVIVRPQAFRLSADGHRLSTRHAGIDFENGVSVVVGVDNPPDFFECQPASRHYSVHAHMDLTFTIAASERNVWAAAKRYREVDPYKPAPTLTKLAGRFVFDLWGGWRYAWVAEQLEKAFRYGCTDALVIYHNWQRWGYDYRLPDIFPPNPQFGTLEDFVKMVEVCNRYGVLFALHDNYIDFYPDTEGYSYRHICFTPDGNPIRAWFNEARRAQSYRWRPDAFFPFMERNLKLIAKHIRPTAYFVDVFSSIGMFDFWTEDGEFRSILETQKRWGEAFNFIRNILGGAPQTSESGCDWLINWLDGATTNHLRVDPKAPPGQWAVWRIQCEDAERIPWFDFAHHHRFALHGAGYSNRYQGGLPYEVAGIYSDDYICTEVLTGHPAMVSEPFGPQVVRKYWLLSELGRALALAKMDSVEFADGDIHRQIVRWQLASVPATRVPRPPSRVPTEAIVWVNRSGSDWEVNNRILPPFGFYAVVPTSSTPKSLTPSPQLQAAIEKLPTTDGDKVIAEWALSDRFAYCNARTKVLFGWTPIQLVGVEVRWLGNRKFELTLRWKADKPTDEPHHVFVHFTNPKSQRGEQIAFQGDHAPDLPTTQWQGEVVTRTVVTVPEQWGADRYSVRVGLWNPKTGYRLRLMGEVDDTLRIVVGDLVLKGEGGNITGARLELNPNLTKMPEWLKRWNTQGKAVDFGFAVTDGAFRFDRKNLTLIPLPEHAPFTVTLRLQKLLGTVKRITAIEAIDESGKVIGNVPFVQRNGEVTFQTQASVFGYRLR